MADNDTLTMMFRGWGGVQPLGDEIHQKSLYTLKTQENGELVQRGMACAVEARLSSNEKAYFLLTSSSVISQEDHSHGEPVTADRYCSQYPKHAKSHQITTDSPKQVYSFSFLPLDKKPTHYLIHRNEESIHQTRLQTNPALVSYTFCGKTFIQLQFEFVQGDYRLTSTVPKEAGQQNAIGAPVLIREDAEDLVVGVVGTRVGTNELYPMLIYGAADPSQQNVQTGKKLTKLISDEGKAVRESVEMSKKDIVDGVRNVQDAFKRSERTVVENVECAVKTTERTVLEEVEGVKQEVKEVNENLQRLENSRSKEVPKTCLPDMPPHFTGRQTEIDDVVTHVTSSSTRLFTIWGSGGFGKTALAIAVGHRLHEQGTRTWFVSLRGTNTDEKLLNKLLAFLDQNCSPGKGNSQVMDSLCACLRIITDNTALILDNVDDLLEADGDSKSKFLQSITALLQYSSKLNILCTSREAMNYASLTLKATDVRIGTLQSSESAKLLQELAGEWICTEQECFDLGRVCGHVPLALKLMASAMCQDSVTSRELLLDLKISNILEVIDSEDYPDELRMHKLIEFSFSRLSQENQSMFVCLSIFPSSFDAKAAAAVLDTESVKKAKKSLGLLVRKSLLEYDISSKRYSMHTLLQAFGQLIGAKDKEMYQQSSESHVRFHSYFIKLMVDLNEHFLTGRSLYAVQCFHRDKENFVFSLQNAATFDELKAKVANQLSNMDIWLDTIFWSDNIFLQTLYDRYHNKGQVKTTGQSISYAKILLSKVFGVLHWRDHYADQLLSEADEVIRELPSVLPDIHGKLFCYFGFRKLMSKQTNEGIMLLEKGIPLLDATIPDTVIKVLALNILANWYMMNDNTRFAAEKFQAARDLCENHEELKSILITLPAGENEDNNQANQPFLTQIFYFLSNISSVTRFSHQVKDFLCQAIKGTDKLRVSEGGTVDIAQQYYVHAQSFANIRCNVEALAAFRHALDIRLKIFGEDNEDTARSYHSLGLTHYELREYSSALNAHRHALDIRLKILGEDNEVTATSYYNLGVTHYELSDYSSALDAHRHALDISLKILGENNEDTAWSYHNLGMIHYKLSNYSSALDAHKHALDIRLKILGEDNEDTARSKHYVCHMRFLVPSGNKESAE